MLALGILSGACSNPSAPTPTPQITFVDVTVRYSRPAEYHTNNFAAAGFTVFRGSGGMESFAGVWDEVTQTMTATFRVPQGMENLVYATDRALPAAPYRAGWPISAGGGVLPTKPCDNRAPEPNLTCAVLVIQQ